MYCFISTSTNYPTKGLRFHPCTATSIDNFLQLLKITGYQECYLFSQLSKYAFLFQERLINKKKKKKKEKENTYFNILVVGLVSI